jgi:hypothetical protein
VNSFLSLFLSIESLPAVHNFNLSLFLSSFCFFLFLSFFFFLSLSFFEDPSFVGERFHSLECSRESLSKLDQSWDKE